MQPTKPKTIVYIDGYNWYHAIFKHYPEWKWLNVQSFFEAMRPHEEIVSVKVFSAMIDPDNEGSDARMRQQRYFDALRTLPKVEVILGMFQPREVTCKANGCKYSYHEEKKTDTNITVAMMSDAFADRCRSMCVVSGDSDLQPPIEWIANNLSGIKITVYIPALPQDQAKRRLDYYTTARLSVECKFLPLDNIIQHQLKSLIKLPNGNFSARPETWKKPN
jgi:hypothetical protein